MSDLSPLARWMLSKPPLFDVLADVVSDLNALLSGAGESGTLEVEGSGRPPDSSSAYSSPPAADRGAQTTGREPK